MRIFGEQKPKKRMKKSFYTLLIAAVCAVLPLGAEAKDGKMPAPERKAFSNVSIGVHAGLTGYGLSVATPLHRTLALRAGFSTMPLSLKYNNDNGSVDIAGFGTVDVPDMRLKATLGMTHGHLLFDWSPFRRGKSSFFISFGAYFGNSKLIKLSGKFNEQQLQALIDQGLPMSEIANIPVRVGDTNVMVNEDGSMNAHLKVWAVKPYVGLGFGRPIPKRRVGFRGELGVMFIGKPKVVSNNIADAVEDGSVSNINKILGKVIVYPQLQLTLTVRLLKDK